MRETISHLEDAYALADENTSNLDMLHRMLEEAKQDMKNNKWVSWSIFFLFFCYFNFQLSHICFIVMILNILF